MSFEQHEQAEQPQRLQQVEDWEIFELAEALQDLNYPNLSSLLNELAEQDDASLSQKNLDDVSRAFARHASLFPETAEQLKAALSMIKLEWAETNKTQFKSREDYLQDLDASPQKFVSRSGKTLQIKQPGNSVRYTHINDFISPTSKIVPMEDPQNYQLTHKEKVYQWDQTAQTWTHPDGRLKLLKKTEEIEITQKERIPTKEEVYNAVHQAVQPMVDAEGTTRGGFVQIRNHLFDGHNRPDPVERAYYYYGQSFKLNPKTHLAYTGKTPERHKKVAKVIRESFIRTLPGAGGGIPNREEIGIKILLDQNITDIDMQNEILDKSYKESVQLINDYYDAKPEATPAAIKNCIRQKALFDAQFGSFMQRIAWNNDGDTATDIDYSTRKDLYEIHSQRVVEASIAYGKSLNQLPSSMRSKVIQEEIIPRLEEASLTLAEEAPEQYKRIQHYMNLLIRSLQRPANS